MSQNYYRGYRSSSWSVGEILSVLFVGFIILCICGRFLYSCSYALSDETTYTATVTKMEVKNKSNDSKYLVFTRLVDTDEVRVFQITDSYSHARFDSSDLYGTIEEGKTYVFTVYGYRSEYLSEYENILSAEEVPESAAEIQ